MIGCRDLTEVLDLDEDGKWYATRTGARDINQIEADVIPGS